MTSSLRYLPTAAPPPIAAPRDARGGYDRSFAPYVVPARVSLHPEDLPDARWFALMLQSQARAAIGATAARVRHAAPRWVRDTAPARRLGRLADALVPARRGAVASSGDAELAWLCFAGTNPLQVRRVRRVDELPDALRLADDAVASLLGPGASLGARAARGDVFVVRHDALATTTPADLQPGRFVAPTTLLLAWAPEMNAPFPVVPLAIECPLGRPGGETAVVTPLDDERWPHAKRLAQVADVHASELCVHLARTHFMTVPFALALRSALPRTHPLRAFLMPHLRFDAFVDHMAWQKGVRRESGQLVRSLAGTARWSQDVARTVHAQLSFREQHFERDLATRGLDDHPVDYPYRDDGRLLWGAIRRFVAAWVERAWATDAALARDAAIAAFVAELSDPARGNVRGLLRGERLEARDELVEILTQVIFVAGPLHALAHYGSATQLRDVERNPSWLVGNPMARGRAADPGPIAGLAAYERVVGTDCRYDRFGDFSRYALGRDARSADLLDAFRADLDAIERTIEARNERRHAPFVHFLPSRLTNGITV